MNGYESMRKTIINTTYDPASVLLCLTSPAMSASNLR